MAKIIADFRTSLATKLAVGGTSFTLQSATDDDGVALPAGKYYFTCDGESSQKEHFYCDLAGANATNVQSVSRQGTKTSGAVREHRVGATITITDFAHIKDIADFVDQYDGKWMGAVADYAALLLIPTPNDGEVRVTLDDSKIYVYDLDTTTWNLAGAGGGAGTVYRTTLLGTESTGDDNKTFTMTSGSFPDKKYFQVYKNGVLMGEGATNDYVATGSNQAVFNEVVLDDDVIDLLVISVDLYNPAWNSVNDDILPDIDNTYDIGGNGKRFKSLHLSEELHTYNAYVYGEINGDAVIDPDNLPIDPIDNAHKIIKLNNNGELPTQPLNNLERVLSSFVVVPSDTIVINRASTTNTTATEYTKVAEILYNDSPGNIRVSFTLNTSCWNCNKEHKGRVYKNGAAYGTEQTLNPYYAGSTKVFQEDLYFETGDLIQVYGKVASNEQANYLNISLGYDKHVKSVENIINY